MLKQTYANIEVILVNDASKDRTLQIAEKMAQRDGRLKVFNQPTNQGVDRARFRGIAEATGEYITFVDSDDFLPLDAIEALWEEAKKTDADIVEGGMYRVFDGLGFFKRQMIPQARAIAQPELFDDFYISFFGINKLSVALCGKLFRKQLFDEAKLKPSGMRMGEDLLVSMQLFPLVKRYALLPKAVYYYRWGGVTSGYNATLYTDIKRQYGFKKEVIARYNYQKALPFAKIEMCNVAFTQCMQMLRYGKGHSAAADFLKTEIASGFIDEVANGYETRNPKIKLLRNHDIEGFLSLAQAEADNKKWLRRLIVRFQWLLRYI